MGWSFANWMFFKRVRKAMGLDRCHFPMTGAAPIRSDVLDYFMSVNIPVHELYGMSETSGSVMTTSVYPASFFTPSSLGPTTVTTADCIRYRSSGRPIDGSELMIKDPDGEGVGEVGEGVGGMGTCVGEVGAGMGEVVADAGVEGCGRGECRGGREG